MHAASSTASVAKAGRHDPSFRAPTLMDWAATHPDIARLVGGQDRME